MKSTTTLIIPENLDIDAIIQQNPFGFYGQGLKKEYLLFICSELLKSRAYHRKEMLETNTPFAPLCGKYLKQIANDYEKYMQYLLKEKILLTDGHFKQGEKCKGYCFNAPYNGKRLKRIEVKSYTLKKALRRRAFEWEKAKKNELRGYSYLTKWLDSEKLKIDEESAFKWIEQYRVQKLEELARKKRVHKRAFKIETIHNTAEDFKQLVRSINEGSHYYKFSGRGHRFYNLISNLKRELRTFLTYDGQPLVDVDISNSQPFLLLVLLQSYFWKPKEQCPSGKICLERLDKEIYNRLKRSRVLVHIITLLKSLEQADNESISLKNYKYLVLNAEFYRYIKEKFEPIYQDRFDEGQKVKREMLRIKYVNPRDEYHPFYAPCQTFNAYFPEVYELLQLIKSVEYTDLPIILQRLESFLVLDVVCKQISHLQPQIPLLTIHDCILRHKEMKPLLGS